VKEKNLLFVYGTLKRGFPNYFFLSDSQFIGIAKTVERFSMFVKGDIPFVLKYPRVSNIKGEVFLVTLKTLKLIDALEGHPSEYRREPVLIVLEEKKLLKAWMYFYHFTEEPGTLLPLGEFLKKHMSNC